MNITKEEVGKRIKQAITAAGVTQRTIAKEIGLTEGAVSNYANGLSEPSANGYSIIARLCNTSIDWMISGVGHGPGEIHSIHPGHSTTAETNGYGFDADLMREAIIIVRNGEEQTDLKLKPEKAADIALMIYETYIKGEKVSQEKVIQLIRLAA